MDIGTLRYFIEVVRQQSFTCAAGESFIIQPTISKISKNLEDRLNCVLLIHDGCRLLLTDTDRVVFECGLASLAELRQLETEFSDISRLKTGALRLGIPPMVGMLMAGPASLFRQCYPDVELKISEFGDLTIQQVVMNGELDMTLTALPVEEGGLTTLSLFSRSLRVLTPHSSKWLECDTVSPKTLAERPLLIYSEGFTLSKQLIKLFDEYSVKPRIAVHNG